ncbi:MAG: two pore domain potassium channel family protein [Flavobacteriales bacterium]|nr:two pore domain potassium channel family protein [Flavobacteriales bacterium]
MANHVKKLLVGKPRTESAPRRSVIAQRWENIRGIWNNDHDEDAGIEKVVRLLLAASQFLFPGMYIKHLFWRKGPVYQELAVEFFVMGKTLFPVAVLYFGWQEAPWIFALVVWLMMETILYIPTLIFASDAFSSPRSYRRSQIMIFFNYLEVVFSFGVIHAAGRYLNEAFVHWADPIYFSFMATSTIGFGDLYPVTPTGKLVVGLQSLFYLSYLVLFINFFSIGHQRGYFAGKSARGPE